MSSSGTSFKTIAFEDGAFAVVQIDVRKPRLMEVIAIFYDASCAREYTEIENKRQSEEPANAPAAVIALRTVELASVSPELSARQSAVLIALRTRMDENQLIEVKAAVLAHAANIPLGSLHSVLQSLERKQLILTKRPGSARAPAVYQVL